MPRRKRPELGVDYIMDSDGHAQFTEQYLLKQGYCCNAACRYCPYLSKPSSKISLTSAVGAASVTEVQTSASTRRR